MRYITTALALTIATVLGGCEYDASTYNELQSSEIVRDCDTIRDGIIRVAAENGVNIVKIYDPTPVESNPTKVSCSGIALLGSGLEAPMYYQAKQDKDGDWLLMYSDNELD